MFFILCWAFSNLKKGPNCVGEAFHAWINRRADCQIKLQLWNFFGHSHLKLISNGWNGCSCETYLDTIVKADKPWVKWVRTYYVRGRSIKQCLVSSLPRMVMKILGCFCLVEQAGGWSSTLDKGEFKIQCMYKLLQSFFPKVSWRKLICNSQATSKSWVVSWFLCNDRLLTADVSLKYWLWSCLSSAW